MQKKADMRKLICAFTENRKNLVHIWFDKMILRFLYYPVMGIAPEDKLEIY
jgi:hypothetical protein